MQLPRLTNRIVRGLSIRLLIECFFTFRGGEKEIYAFVSNKVCRWNQSDWQFILEIAFLQKRLIVYSTILLIVGLLAISLMIVDL